jgi:hypothetical protein
MQTVSKTETRHGIIPGVATFALDLVDRGQSTTIGVLHDVRHELRAAVDGSIELAEKVSASLFRLAKKIVQRIDDASAETLASAEKLVGGAVKNARETSRIAGELAHSAVSGVTGPAQQAQA